MCAGSVLECYGFSTLSASVILLGVGCCMRYANKFPKIRYSVVVREVKKVIRNLYLELDHYQTLTSSSDL